jgi:hypothetical protein
MSDYIALKGTITELQIGKDLKGNSLPGWTNEKHKNISLESQCPNQNLNWLQIESKIFNTVFPQTLWGIIWKQCSTTSAFKMNITGKIFTF